MRVNKKEYVARAVLGVVASSGLIAVVAVAPGVSKLLKYVPALNPKQKANRNYYINHTVRKLVSQGFIKTREDKNGFTNLTLTPKGEVMVESFDSDNFEFEKPKHWDGKWRILIFDIRERVRRRRDEFRHYLLQLGFRKLQNSVWVFPYECEKEIAILRTNFGIEKDVLYITAEKIENSESLKKDFNLN